jgi:rubrerythrin
MPDAQLPIDLAKVSLTDIDKQCLRTGMVAETDAVSLYEQLAASADNPLIKALFLDIAREEKVHLGEFQAVLLGFDPQQRECLAEGAAEVEKLIKEYQEKDDS